MDEQVLAQLDRRMEEHHRFVRHQLEDLCETVRTSQATLTARMDAHEAYHRGHEHRWGLVRLAGRHPFRLAAGVALVVAVAASTAPETAQWLGRLVGGLAGLLGR